MDGSPPLDGLAVLLDGYFHEDFRAEYGSHEAAASAFVRDANEEERETAGSAMEAFVSWAETAERETWQAALRRAGGSWRPRSLRPLREVLAVVQGAI